MTGLTKRRPSASMRRRRPDASTGELPQGCGAVNGGRRPAGPALGEQPRVHEVAVELDHPVEVRAGRVAGVALVADDLALPDGRAGAAPGSAAACGRTRW